MPTTQDNINNNIEQNVEVNNTEVTQEETPVENTSETQTNTQDTQSEVTTDNYSKWNIPTNINDVTFESELRKIIKEQIFSKNESAIEDIYNDVYRHNEISDAQQQVLQFCIIQEFLIKSGVDMSWTLKDSLNNQEELFDEFDNLGFSNENPFIKYLSICTKNGLISSINELGFAAIHNAYVENDLNYKDLQETGLFGKYNIIFNKTFFTRTNSYNDKMYLLKIQQYVREKNTNLFDKLNASFLGFLSNLPETSGFTTRQIWLGIFLYNQEKDKEICNKDKSGNYQLYNLDESCFATVKTAGEARMTLVSYKDETTETDNNLVGNQKNSIPNDWSDDSTKMKLLRLFDERLGDAKIHKDLVAISDSFDRALSQKDRFDIISIANSSNINIWNLTVAKNILKQFIDKNKQNQENNGEQQ